MNTHFEEWVMDAERRMFSCGEKVEFDAEDNTDCIMDQLFAEEWLQ